MSAVDYIHRLAQITRLQAFIFDGAACRGLKASRLSRPPTWLDGVDRRKEITTLKKGGGARTVR
jgi:hypothetical protein